MTYYIQATSSTTASSLSPKHTLDLSFEHHRSSDYISNSIGSKLREVFRQSVGRIGDRASRLSVDLSSTLIGDAGAVQVMKAISQQEGNKGDFNGEVWIELSVRTNQLTSVGASTVFQSLVNMSQPRNKTSDNSFVEEIDSDTQTGEGVSLNGTGIIKADDYAATKKSPLYVETLDMSLNGIGEAHKKSQQREFSTALRSLIENKDGCCPRILRLDCCELNPSACRAIGKGILEFAKLYLPGQTDGEEWRRRLSSLHLTGNDLIGDAGAAALAAALRTASRDGNRPILDTLDLSSCGISDAGCEALAMAIRDNPGCIRTLDLSNNKISDDGAIALGKALAFTKSTHVMTKLDLSNNKEVTDRGASALATGIERGVLRSLVIRSCSIRADGAMSVGKALCLLASNGNGEYSVDLSGNELGTMEVKKKKGQAGLLKSKASATGKAYMSYFSKKIQSVAKEAGISNFSSSTDSDDDEDEVLEQGDSFGEDSKTMKKCGARTFADAIIDESNDNAIEQKNKHSTRCSLGMRHCFLDERAADALAAAILRSREAFNLELFIDTTMNVAFDESIISTLKGGDINEDLRHMAQTHFDAAEALRIARERAQEAVTAASARSRAESVFDGALGDDFDYSDGGFDSFPEAGDESYGYGGDYDAYDDLY